MLQSRAKSREKAEEQERDRRRSIQNFRDSRVQTYRHNKEQEVSALLRKVNKSANFMKQCQAETPV